MAIKLRKASVVSEVFSVLGVFQMFLLLFIYNSYIYLPILSFTLYFIQLHVKAKISNIK